MIQRLLEKQSAEQDEAFKQRRRALCKDLVINNRRVKAEQADQEQVERNIPFDELAFNLVTAEGYPWENGAVGYYLRDAGMPLDNMSNTTQVFLGTQMVCAQYRIG